MNKFIYIAVLALAVTTTYTQSSAAQRCVNGARELDDGLQNMLEANRFTLIGVYDTIEGAQEIYTYCNDPEAAKKLTPACYNGIIKALNDLENQFEKIVQNYKNITIGEIKQAARIVAADLGKADTACQGQIKFF